MSYDADQRELIVDEVCGYIAAGRSLRAICDDPDLLHLPDKATFLRWVAGSDDFATRYARACAIRAEVHVDEMQEIADDGRNDWMERLDKDGQPIGWVLNGEAVARSKLRLEQRRWYAEKLVPKKYGTKVAVEHSVDTSLAERLARARARANGES